jgi:hypothetical protein
MRADYDRDAGLNLIKGAKIAMIAYGSHRHAHTFNQRVESLMVPRPPVELRNNPNRIMVRILETEPEPVNRGFPREEHFR